MLLTNKIYSGVLRVLSAAAILSLFFLWGRYAHAGTNKEYYGETVLKIEFRGLQRVDEANVAKVVKQKVGEELDPAVVTQDIKALFTLGVFDDVKASLIPGEGGVTLVYRLKERPVINAIRIEGNDELSEEEINKVINIKAGAMLDIAKVENIVGKIKDLYVDEGYFLAEVDYRIVELPENSVDVLFIAREYAKVEIKNISFVGNRNIPDHEIKEIMQTREGGFFSWLSGAGKFKEEFFAQDLERIEFLYLTKGYINVKVSDPVVALSKDRKFIFITISIEEGDKYTVGEVDIAGDLLIPKEELKAKLTLKKGDVFNAMNVQMDTITLGDAYKDMGYAYATVSNTHVAHPETKTVDFTYILQKGNKAYFGRIDIIGNDGTRDWTIRRELLIFEGDLYNETNIKKSKARIQRLGFFDKVEIKPKKGRSPELIDIEVEVKERQTGSFTVGAGFSSIENFLFQAQIQKQNFLGRGQNLSFQAILSSIRTIFSLSFEEPYFFDTNWTFGIDLYNYDILYFDFTRGTSGGSVTFGHRFTDELGVSLSYKLEEISVSYGGQRGNSTVPVKRLTSDGLTSSLTGTVYYDSRDDRMFPTKGNFSSASVEWAGSEVGSENLYTKYSLRARQYFPFIFGSVFKLSGTFGYTTSPDPEGVPMFERFFVGGIFTVRGFERYSLGPTMLTAAAYDPAATLQSFTLGGNKQLIFNSELEFPIFQQIGIRGVLFFDAGNAFDDDEMIDLLKLRTSVGFGIRWWSPIGPLRFEWGFPLRPKAGEPPVVFEFNIGMF